MNPREIEELLSKTHDESPKIRRAALLQLCPCHIRSDVSDVWDRLFELQDDDDNGVRSIVLHHLCDGSPKSRRDQVVETLERFAQDPDKSIRRRARRAIAIFRRTGKIVES